MGRDHPGVVVVHHRVHGGGGPDGDGRGLVRVQARLGRPVVGDAGHLAAQETGAGLDLPVPGADPDRLRLTFQEIHHDLPLIGVGEDFQRVPYVLVEAPVDGI